MESLLPDIMPPPAAIQVWQHHFAIFVFEQYLTAAEHDLSFPFDALYITASGWSSMQSAPPLELSLEPPLEPVFPPFPPEPFPLPGVTIDLVPPPHRQHPFLMVLLMEPQDACQFCPGFPFAHQWCDA